MSTVSVFSWNVSIPGPLHAWTGPPFSPELFPHHSPGWSWSILARWNRWSPQEPPVWPKKNSGESEKKWDLSVRTFFSHLDLNINPVRAVLYLQGWQGQFWGCCLGLWRTRFPMSDCQVVDSWLINKSWTIIMKFGAAEQRIPQQTQICIYLYIIL